MDDLRAAIDAEANPADATVLARYFQAKPGGYGEGDVFIGVKLSALRRVVRPYVRHRFVAQDWLPLLTSPVHEHRLATLVVMSQRADRGEETERGSLYCTYLEHSDRIDNWDLVDVSAAAVVGGYLVGRDRSVLLRLARSPVIWERRIAVSTHRFLRAGESADTYAVATALLNDTHDLIHKAVGWSLREAGRRVDAGELRSFVDRWAPTMPRTILRYAIEHFDPDERRYFLGRRRP